MNAQYCSKAAPPDAATAAKADATSTKAATLQVRAAEAKQRVLRAIG